MDINILDTDLSVVDILDAYESLIWSDRYSQCGDFELITPLVSKNVEYLIPERYLETEESEHLMIIETVNITTDAEKGNRLMIKGRSLESILDRRRVGKLTILNDVVGDLQDCVELLLNNNAINADNTDRNISRLIFEATTDPVILALNVDDQFNPENSLYEAITKICIAANIGYKITLTDNNEFKFKLYSGIDRSYNQSVNSYIAFTPKFENIINGNYEETTLYQRTVSYVAGEKGIGNERTTIEVAAPGGALTDLNRREMYTDASGVSRNVPNEDPLTEEEYELKLIEKGQQDLSLNTFLQTFEGQIDTATSYIFNVDYFMGDIVQVNDEYGHETRSRVTEVIRSEDPSGILKYPTFIAVI